METLGLQTEEEFQKEQLKFKNGYASYNRIFLLFLLIEKSSGLIIGRCGLHNWNVDHNRAEIGYHMTIESKKQKGLMSEAVKAILDYGFFQLKLHRIEALVGTNNTASLKIMEKYGFVKEGTLRQHYLVDGIYEDSAAFSILRNEYFDDL